MRADVRGQRAGETVFLSFLNFIFLLFCLMRTEGGAREIKRETKTVFHWCCSVKLSWHSIFTTYCNAAADLCVRVRERQRKGERESERDKETKGGGEGSEGKNKINIEI